MPNPHKGDYEFLADMLAWDANVDPNFASRRELSPIETSRSASADGRFVGKWVAYTSSAFSAKELTVPPGATVTLAEADAFGIVCVQGRGTFAGLPLETVTMVTVSDITNDEYFVTVEAAQRGVKIRNSSSVEPLVRLKHFGPGNVELLEESFPR